MSEGIQKELEKYFDRLWPLCRSITGNGVRETLAILQELIPLEITEVPTGTKVHDWEIPDEWNINDAFIITPDGKKICDFKKNNLHVVNYSEPIHAEIEFDELNKHLFTIPGLPQAIPYITSYYKKDWGFCMSYNEYKTLPKQGKYKIVIDSRLEPGSLTYGHLILKGNSEKEVLFSTYICHPGMANNELSGPLTLAFLYRLINNIPNRKYSYRFVFAPETIGAITCLFLNGIEMKKNTIAGLVATCCGTNCDFTYKKSRLDQSLIDLVTSYVLKKLGKKAKIVRFDPVGSDERQYGSPGYNLPVGSLMRSKYHEYPEYHTSLDNKELISFSALAETVEVYYSIVQEIENARYYTNKIMMGEPNLGRRGVYSNLAGKQQMPEDLLKRMRLINFMDGHRCLAEFCGHYDYSLSEIETEVDLLVQKGILE